MQVLVRNTVALGLRAQSFNAVTIEYFLTA